MHIFVFPGAFTPTLFPLCRVCKRSRNSYLNSKLMEVLIENLLLMKREIIIIWNYNFLMVIFRKNQSEYQSFYVYTKNWTRDMDSKILLKTWIESCPEI